MTVETLLLTGIGSVTGALAYVSKILFERANKCEQDRDSLRTAQNQMQTEFASLQRTVGKMEGELLAFKSCTEEACPFKPDAPG